MKPSVFRLSLPLLFCLFLAAPDAWSKADIGRKHVPYLDRAENETLPALSDFCNGVGQRMIDLRHMKDELWFLFDQNNDAHVETYDPALCSIYSDLFLKTCNLVETIKSYSAGTCPNGNRLDWSLEKASRKYRPCNAGCPKNLR